MAQAFFRLLIIGVEINRTVQAGLSFEQISQRRLGSCSIGQDFRVIGAQFDSFAERR